MAIKLDQAIDQLRRSHPRARFFQVGEVSAGQTDNEISEQKFQYISLYEHRITSVFVPFKGHFFIVSNGFLSSHIYNLALVWVWYSRAEHASKKWLDAALRHNLKKFFAECALAERNCLIARALLIETLMYEQDLMRPIFDEIEKNPLLKEISIDLANLMSSILENHELAHFLRHRSPDDFLTYITTLFDGSVGQVVERVTESFGQPLAEEIICDAFAAHITINGDNQTLQKYDVITRARMTTFLFLVFPYLVSLEKSALVTTNSCVEEDATIDISSEKRPKVQFSFKQGLCRDTDFRATEIVKLISDSFENKGQIMFGEDKEFPLPISSQQFLYQAFNRFAKEIDPIDGGLTGTDINRRGLAQLLAESLHGYDQGAEFLLWRSKRFSVGGQAIDP